MDNVLVIDPLTDEDLLVHADLWAPHEVRGDFRRPPIRESGVRCARPFVYPVAPRDLPPALRKGAESQRRRYLGVLFAFDLDPLALGRRYGSAEFRIRMDGEQTIALHVHVDGDTLGVVYGADGLVAASAMAALATDGRPAWTNRLPQRGNQAVAEVFGVRSSEFGWMYRESPGTRIVASAYAMHVLIEAPAEMAQINGTVEISADIVRTMLLKDFHHVAKAVATFTEPAPMPLRGGENPAAAVRLCMAADIKGYSELSNVLQERMQERLVTVLARSRAHAGLDEDQVYLQPQGDGQFAVFPFGIDESTVIPRLVDGLEIALRDVNLDLRDRMRMRVALHRGFVKPAESGWVGNAAVAVHRILDAPPTREALDASPDADYVLAVPEVLYRDIVAHSYENLAAGTFREALVDLPAKNFVERVWLRTAEPSTG